jgi:hypothetical protein
MRVSDADRDAAIAELSEHFQVGRLTQEEYEERSGLALRAKTGSDLSELFTDLPLTTGAAQPVQAPPSGTDPSTAGPPWAPAPSPSRDIGRRGRSPAQAIIAVVIAVLVIGGLSGTIGQLSSGSGTHQADIGWVVPVIILMIVSRGISRSRRR